MSTNCEHLKPFSDAPTITPDVGTLSAHSPPWESLWPVEDTKEPMHLDGYDSRRKDPLASAPIIDKGKTIMIDSDDDSQIASMDGPMDASDQPIDMYTVTRVSSIDCSLPLLSLVHQPCM